MRKTAPAFLAILAIAAIARAEDPAASRTQAGEAARQAEERAGQEGQQPQTQRQRQQGQQQQATQRQQGQQRRQAGFRGSESGANLDAHIADCLILANQEEVAVLRMGAERAQSEEVKEFAKKAIEDHEKAISELQKFGSGKHAQNQLQAGATEERRETPGESRIATREARKPAAGEAAAGTEGNLSERMFAIQHRAAQECLKLTQQELSKWKGEEFDQAFLGQQTGAHIGMLAHLKALQGEVSQELQEVVDRAEKVTMEHKEKADELMKQLSKSDHSEGQEQGERSRRERSNTESRNQ